jgi:hypothetical protein
VARVRFGCVLAYKAIRALERLVPGLFGKASAWRWRVVRTSNGYAFRDPALFSDLVGSTALSARMDPEDLRELCLRLRLLPLIVGIKRLNTRSGKPPLKLAKGARRFESAPSITRAALAPSELGRVARLRLRGDEYFLGVRPLGCCVLPMQYETCGALVQSS